MGFLSVVVLDVQVSLFRMRNMLFCDECCGIPIYSNTPYGICKQCQMTWTLRLNPRIIGLIVDGTGSIVPGKLLFTSEAWRDLLGHSEEELAGMDVHSMKYLEQRMCGSRVSLIFGWAGPKSEETGKKLCILGARE